jgi:hypothetical protein
MSVNKQPGKLWLWKLDLNNHLQNVERVCGVAIVSWPYHSNNNDDTPVNSIKVYR